MHSADDHHAHLRRGIESIRTLAERADRNAIDRLLTQPPAINNLDDHTLDFLRRAQDLLLTTTQILTTILETQASPNKRGHQQDGSTNTDPCPATHSPSAAQNNLTPVDVAEAWRRADLHLPRHHEHPILLHIQEFEDGYQAIPIQVSIPEPPSIPNIETPTTLVIDKATGAVTRWPLLCINVLSHQYRRYRRQAPMTFDDCE
ncbi:hypothetical protein AB0C74_24030 [Spirillospora sp. NPDC048832]